MWIGTRWTSWRPKVAAIAAQKPKEKAKELTPEEKLLRAMLLQIFYSIRSERLLMEQTQYNLLFRLFIGLSMGDTVWVPTAFSKKRERLIAHEAVIELFNEVPAIANKNEWLSGEHFSVDGTLIQAWASHKSFARKDGSDDDTGNFKNKKRSNDTTSPPPMQTHGFTASARPPPSCASRATHCAITATA